MRSPSRSVLRALTPYTPGIRATWSPVRVRSALKWHEEGDFSESSKLIESMGRDDRLSSVLETRVKGVLGLPFSLTPLDEENDAERQLCEELGNGWRSWVPESTIAELLKWRSMLGFAVASIEWKTSEKSWTPSIRVWHPEFVSYDTAADEWRVSTKEGPVTIEPGDGRWILLGRGRRPFMTGLVRCLAIPFLVRQFALRDWARYSERHGMPIVLARVPVLVEAEDREEFFDGLKALSTDTTVLTPTGIGPDGQGYDLELLEASDQSWDGFQQLIATCNTSYAVTLLGQNLTTEVDGGSFAAAHVHNRIRADYLEADAEELSTELRGQFLTPVVQVLKGEGTPVPVPRWHHEPPEDEKVRAETLKANAEALAELRSAGFAPKNVEQLSAMLGIELVEAEPPAPSELSASRLDSVTLASGDDPRGASSFVGGQLFVDGVGDEGLRVTRSKIAGDLEKVIAVIDDADSYEGLREKLLETYSELDPTDFAVVMEKALILSELAGLYAMQQEAKE